jgi:hypothetical protein
LVAVIVILAVAIGIMFLSPTLSKDATVVKITSDKSQNEGGKLKVLLTDTKDQPISKDILNVTITNKNGEIVLDDVVKTDGDGKAKLNLDLKKGKYTVKVNYDGNEKYEGSNTTQKLTIKEKKAETSSSSSSSSQSTQSSQPQRTAYAYRSDGSPMYSQGEVDSYMYNKYGSVNYHVGSNGYIDMDEPGYDDAGHWVGY